MLVTDGYITLWEHKETANGYYRGQASEGRKKQDGSYVNSYYTVREGKDIAGQLSTLPTRTRIHVTRGVISNEAWERKDGTKAMECSLLVLDYEVMDGNAQGTQPQKPTPAKKVNEPVASDDLPF